MQARHIPLYVLLAAAASACAGATKEAEAPEGDSQSADTHDTPDATSDEAVAEESGLDEVDDESSEPVTSAVDPRDTLLHEGAVFLLNYRESDIGKKQDAECEEQSKGDPALKAKCRSAALDRVTREGLLFEKNEQGELVYVRIGVEKGKKVVYNHVRAELSEPDGDKVTVKTSGRDQARPRRGTVPSQFVLQVPDEYTVIFNDPKKGKMVYEQRLGMFKE